MINKLKKNNGITMVALVITIIVLMILAMVSVKIVIDGKLAEHTQKSTTEYKKGSEKEAISLGYNNYVLAQKNGESVTKPDVEGANVEDMVDNEWKIKFIETNNEYSLSSDGNTIESLTPTPKGLEVGTAVRYSPSGTYTWKGEYCSDSQNDVVLNSSSGGFRVTNWKVLSIGKDNITLIADMPTSGTVYLGQAQGYNNGVKLLNEACNNLYGNSEKGINARNMSIEDIEKYMTKDALNSVYGAEYNRQQNAYKSNKYYPSIYAKEKMSVINENKEEKGINRSEQDSFIEKKDEKLEAKISIQPYNTNWDKNNDFMKTAFKTTANGINYYDLLINSSRNYWIATRSIKTNNDVCYYIIQRVYFGNIGAGYMYYSNNGTGFVSFGLQPIITVSKNLIEGDTTNGFSIK